MNIKELEKQHKTKRSALLSVCNRIKSDFSFRKINTWHDVYQRQGLETMPENSSITVTFQDIKTYTAKLIAEQEVRFGKEMEDLLVIGKVEPAPTNGTSKHLPEEPKLVIEAPAIVTTPVVNEDDYGLPFFPNLGCFLYWFQKKAVKVMLDNALGFDVSICKTVDDLKQEFIKRGCKIGKRGQVLISSTGTGKTFMSGVFLKYLIYIGYASNKTFGPVEYLYITRASIVTKTKRDLAPLKIGPKEGLEILNIEQLRSRAGQLWINEKTIVVNGEDTTIWEWRFGMHPVVILLDESQACKNESTQSSILQSYAELDTKLGGTHSCYVSATPFTRVSEAKTLVLNCHLNTEMF